MKTRLSQRRATRMAVAVALTAAMGSPARADWHLPKLLCGLSVNNVSQNSLGASFDLNPMDPIGCTPPPRTPAITGRPVTKSTQLGQLQCPPMRQAVKAAALELAAEKGGWNDLHACLTGSLANEIIDNESRNWAKSQDVQRDRNNLDDFVGKLNRKWKFLFGIEGDDPGTNSKVSVSSLGVFLSKNMFNVNNLPVCTDCFMGFYFEEFSDTRRWVQYRSYRTHDGLFRYLYSQSYPNDPQAKWLFIYTPDQLGNYYNVEIPGDIADGVRVASRAISDCLKEMKDGVDMAKTACRGFLDGKSLR